MTDRVAPDRAGRVAVETAARLSQALQRGL